jgi:hypothetical protein
MSKFVGACALFGSLSLAVLTGCSSSDDDGIDGDPNAGSGGAVAGSGGVTSSAGSGGVSAGSGGVSAASGGAMAMAGAGGGTMTMSTGGTTAAAGGSGGMTSGAGSGGMTAPGGAPTFTRVWTEVLTHKSCNGAFCHGIGMAGLSMKSKDDAYMNLVGVAAAGPSCGTSGKLRVKPGDPDQSLLMDKIGSETPSCGDAMPIGTRFEPNCLSMMPEVCNTQAEIALVRDWIAAGANND